MSILTPAGLSIGGNLGGIGAPPTSQSGTLSYAQLVQLARDAGLDAGAANIAAAVAIAESGGRPLAHNPRPPDDSYGLWQINMLGNLGPARRAQLGIATNDALYDPATNARAMALISGGGGHWTPWSTYTSGAYKRYLNGVSSPPAGPGTTSDKGTPATPVGLSGDDNCLLGSGSIHNPIPGLPNASLPCFFYKSWGWAVLGALALVGGGVVIGVGALVIASKTNTVKDIARFVPGVNPGANRKSVLESAASSQPAASSTTARAPRSFNSDEDMGDQVRRAELGGRGSTSASERRVERHSRIVNRNRRELAATGETAF